MKFEVETNVELDLQELFDGMSESYQADFIRENIGYVREDDLLDEVERRGYITKRDLDY